MRERRVHTFVSLENSGKERYLVTRNVRTLLILFIKGSNPFNETILNTVDIRNCLESFKAFYWVLYYFIGYPIFLLDTFCILKIFFLTTKENSS